VKPWQAICGVGFMAANLAMAVRRLVRLLLLHAVSRAGVQAACASRHRCDQGNSQAVAGRRGIMLHTVCVQEPHCLGFH
jgi:hypothetical protein